MLLLERDYLLTSAHASSRLVYFFIGRSSSLLKRRGSRK
jgi:hypothetical protein